VSKLPPDLLQRRPEEGARLIALYHLAKVEAAAAKLDPQDGDTLHAARVAMRRLRGALGSYRALLPVAADKSRGRLRDIVRETSAARDREVGLQIFAKLDGDPAAKAWLTERWQRRMHRDRRRAIETIEARLPKVVRRLRRTLSRYEIDLTDREPPFGAVAEAITHHEGARLQRSIEKLEKQGDLEAAHQVRLAAKRLRYLIEPLVGDQPTAAPLLEQLTRVQDELGDQRDRALLTQNVEKEAARAPKPLRAALAAIHAS
jgi:CHAD domain-containing protein